MRRIIVFLMLLFILGNNSYCQQANSISEESDTEFVTNENLSIIKLRYKKGKKFHNKILRRVKDFTIVKETSNNRKYCKTSLCFNKRIMKWIKNDSIKNVSIMVPENGLPYFDEWSATADVKTSVMDSEDEDGFFLIRFNIDKKELNRNRIRLFTTYINKRELIENEKYLWI